MARELKSRLFGCAAALVLLGAANACREQAEPPAPFAIGGGEAIVVQGADATCPAEHPNRIELGQSVLCTDDAFDRAVVTRAECAAHRLSCDAIYGCGSMPIEACDATSTSASCGGDGPPTFACTGGPGTDCRWFFGGCAAAGYRPSDCTADDLCCLRTGRGSEVAYPEESLLEAGKLHGYGAGVYTRAFGAQPIGLDDGFHLSVAATEPPPATGTTVTCPENADPFLCGATTFYVTKPGVESWSVSAGNLGSSELRVELRAIDGVTVGRVCKLQRVDVVQNECKEGATIESACASAGTIALGSDRVLVEATFGTTAWTIALPRAEPPRPYVPDLSPACTVAPQTAFVALGFVDGTPAAGTDLRVHFVDADSLELTTTEGEEATYAFEWRGPALPFAEDDVVSAYVPPEADGWIGIEVGHLAALVRSVNATSLVHAIPELPAIEEGDVPVFLSRRPSCSVSGSSSGACVGPTGTASTIHLTQLDWFTAAAPGETSLENWGWQLTNVVSYSSQSRPGGDCATPGVGIEVLTAVRW